MGNWIEWKNVPLVLGSFLVAVAVGDTLIDIASAWGGLMLLANWIKE